MGKSREVKYFKRISTYVYEPFASTKKELEDLLDPDKEAWCPVCKAVVEFESVLDAQGLRIRCPFCYEDLRLNSRRRGDELERKNTGLRRAGQEDG